MDEERKLLTSKLVLKGGTVNNDWGKGRGFVPEGSLPCMDRKGYAWREAKSGTGPSGEGV